MTTSTWNGNNDNWDTTADWTGGVLPGATSDVVINSGQPQIDTNVGAVTQVDDNASLNMFGGGALATTGAFTNTGTVYIDNYYSTGGGGSSLTVGGLLTNLGTFEIGDQWADQKAGSTVTVNSLANSGTINIHSLNSSILSSLVVNSVAGFGTQGSLTGHVELSQDAAIIFASGQVTDIAAGSGLQLDNRNSVVADAGVSSGNSALTGLSTIEGYLNLFDGASVNTSGALTNTGSISVDSSYGRGGGGSSLTVNGLLTNSGTLNVGDPYVDQSKGTTVTVKALTNSGTINLYSAGSLNQAALIDRSVAGLGAAGVLTGQVNLSYDALLEFASGEITDIKGGLLLDGSKSRVADSSAPGANSALTGLATIESTGGLDLRGATLKTTGGLSNAGTLRIDQNYDDGDQRGGGSKVAIGGTLTNSGTVNIGYYYTNTNTTVSVAALDNTGTINLSGDNSNQNGGVTLATLSAGGAAGFGVAGTVTGNVNVAGDAAIVFASGQITDIKGGLLLDGSKSRVADSSAPGANSALTGLATIESTGGLDLRGATLKTTGGLSNAGTLRIDQNYDDGDQRGGGSKVAIGGTLTNSGTVNVGYYYTNTNTTVSVAALDNTGTISLGSGASGQAALSATSGIENNGDLNLYFDSTVSAASVTQDSAGEITLELQGTDAGHHATISATGGLTLNGGTLNTPTNNHTFAAGETFDLFTFAAGNLAGVFNSLGNQADGTTYNLGNGLLLGLEYDNNAGVIEEKIVTAPGSTFDSWNAGSGDWSTTADWSNGAPDFYSAVTISTSASATVTLSTDKTIDTLSLGAADTLSTKAGTDLSIGSSINISGALTVGGEAFVDGAAVNNGVVTINGSVLDIRGAVTGTGGFIVGADAELELGSADAETVTFNGANTTLKLDHPASFSGTLANLVVGDVIDVAGIVVASPTVTGGTTLNFTDGDNNAFAYTLTGFPGGAGFVAQSDGKGGTRLIVTPPAANVTLNPVDGTNTINHAQAAAGIVVGGSVSGLAAGATFSLIVVDGRSPKPLRRPWARMARTGARRFRAATSRGSPTVRHPSRQG